jgi:AcrR family transcriptional regulator
MKSAAVRFTRPTRKRARRSHAERTAETRASIIAAVIDAIAESGFQAATAHAITRRAGVTWGAVQHHFGGKDELLIAVLEDTFTRFAERLADIPDSSSPLGERVSLFVDRAWDHFRSRHFRAAFEILLNYLGREDQADAGTWREQMTAAWDTVWSRIFADASVSRRRSLMLQHYTISTLSGLAATQMMASAEAELPPGELDLIKRVLLQELVSDSTSKQ